MSTIPKRVVTSNTTGAVYRSGRTDFTGQFDPGDYTQQDLLEAAQWVPGVETYYHKVVAGLLEEMTAPEKAAVDAERNDISDSKLEGAATIGKKYNQLSDLPVPPPKAGLLVAIENIGGSWGFAYSTTTGYIVFQSDGVYP